MTTEDMQELIEEVQGEANDLDHATIASSIECAASCETASDLVENLKEARRAAIALASECAALIAKMGGRI